MSTEAARQPDAVSWYAVIDSNFEYAAQATRYEEVLSVVEDYNTNKLGMSGLIGPITMYEHQPDTQRELTNCYGGKIALMVISGSIVECPRK